MYSVAAMLSILLLLAVAAVAGLQSAVAAVAGVLVVSDSKLRSSALELILWLLVLAAVEEQMVLTTETTDRPRHLTG
jgi:hypothetical protein